MSKKIKKLKTIITAPIKIYRLWKLKRKLSDYPDQLKRMESDSDEDFDEQVIHDFKNEN